MSTRPGTGYCLYRSKISPTTHAAWKKVPTSYVVCEDDRACLTQWQEPMLANVEKQGVHIDTYRLNTSHSPFLSESAGETGRDHSASCWRRYIKLELPLMISISKSISIEFSYILSFSRFDGLNCTGAECDLRLFHLSGPATCLPPHLPVKTTRILYQSLSNQ